MKIYYLKFAALPSSDSPFFNKIDNVSAHCWVRADTPESAELKASFMVRRYGFSSLSVTMPPTVVTEESFHGKDIGLKNYLTAQREGISIAFASNTVDGQAPEGPVSLDTIHKMNIGPFLSERKRLSNTGRCLHFDAGSQCTKIIDAHSIQRNGALSLIAENGHVYTISTNYGDVVKNYGRQVYKKQGIKKVSTFRGFCEKHDNQVFKPIDDCPMVPTSEQAFLYAYRSLCKELFLKENALSTSNKMIDEVKKDPAPTEMIEGYRLGTAFGMECLRHHKSLFDETLANRQFSDINYDLFVSNQAPSVVFSGLLYPDFDFCSQRLQDLGNFREPLDLITFSFTPMSEGRWGFLIAWHVSSSRTCVPFMNSLKSKLKEGKKLEDCLFRLLIKGCENLAFNPTWWESLSEKEREEIVDAISNRAEPLVMTQPDYLEHGLEGISYGEFTEVITDIGIQNT